MSGVINKVKDSLKRGILGDVFFKLLANIVQTIVRNIIVLPFLASYFIANEYGELVTVIGVITTVSAGLGNSLLSARLVMESNYTHKNLQGDFNIICWIASGLSVIATPFIAIAFPNQSYSNLIVIALILFLETFTGYQSGWFILKQAYRKLVLYTLVGGIGFGIGILGTNIFGIWTLTYACSDIFCFIFLCLFSPLLKEKSILTGNLKMTLQKYSVLIITTLISNALAYMDRLMLYPTIGSETVAIYTTASFFGKAFSLISTPVSSIMLGYYATERIKLNRKKYWTINLGMLVVLGAFMLITALFGEWFTGILYPQLIQQAAPFILLANLSSAIGATAQITKSATLKYAKTYWTLVIQAIYAIVYIGLGLLMANGYGLWGFTYSVLIANTIQLLLLYVICHISLGERK